MDRKIANIGVSSAAIALILKPIIRLCLKKQFRFREFVKIARATFIQVAEEEIKKSRSKVTISRLSVLTGIYRLDVKSVFIENEPLPPGPMNVLGRVILRWEQDKRFANKKTGEPRVLSCEGEKCEFYQLVRKVSKSLNPATVLFEIQRNGAAEQIEGGLKLIRSVVAVGGSELRGYELLSSDIEALISAVDFNLSRTDDLGYLHLHTEYDRISHKDLPEIRRWLKLEGRVFHKRARDYLSQFDMDLNPDLMDVNEAAARFVLGSFGFAEEVDPISALTTGHHSGT